MNIPRLTYPLPTRASRLTQHVNPETGQSLWITHPWDEPSIFRAMLAGGWFTPGTEFASPQAATFAGKFRQLLEY